MNTIYDIAVIGGGASGMTSAIVSARKGCRVCLLEGLPRVGKKLLATGNGRCNISNRTASAESCHTENIQAVREIYKKCPPKKVWEFLESLGIELSEEDEGRLYPQSGQASSVLDMLRFETERLGVDIFCDSEVTAVRKEKGNFRLTTAEKNIIARRVIFANGSKASPQLGGSDTGIRMLKAHGHTTVPMRPSLVPLRCDMPVLRSLKGVRVGCKASLTCNGKLLYSDIGEVQFVDGTISGIVVFQLSARYARAGEPKATLSLDLMPDKTAEEVLAFLQKRCQLLGYLPMESFLAGVFNKKIAICLMRQATDMPLTEKAEKLTPKQLDVLAKAIKAWDFTVGGTAPWKQAQCMSGGIRLSEFDNSLQSRIVPGIFACGELLDCDCDCGGFNLHWAWTSGIVAGEGASDLLADQY